MIGITPIKPPKKTPLKEKEHENDSRDFYHEKHRRLWFRRIDFFLVFISRYEELSKGITYDFFLIPQNLPFDAGVFPILTNKIDKKTRITIEFIAKFR